MKKLLKSKTAKLAAFGTAVMGSASAFAVDHSTAITAAVDDGSANYTLIITGVITVAAAGFCVGMIVSWLRK
ncbi:MULTISPECIES: hypothetical protein [unclassified Pseudoalteromonas]|uniref:hypothetical protein n=1 Tax=unclassified Pseudoalteromonas TaxID=194690 RepID=UPI0025B3F147|nr:MULTISPECIES: hypothetical protein [unclassified Pseudoalteromonas]MDN3377955.1 hypothetical protein [Pseudoalteromonas sp. APC 3893]MDN3386150.1 hypothetical protein [Pseudoalteromonas sp. APC 4017]